jgi:hypothetical protein
MADGAGAAVFADDPALVNDELISNDMRMKQIGNVSDRIMLLPASQNWVPACSLVCCEQDMCSC